jgi:hypothetical protein
MSDASRRRGAQPLSDRDWLFGSRPRRKLLEGVLLGRQPPDGWTRPELARVAGVVANGGADEHIAGLRRLRLLTVDTERGGVWRSSADDPALAAALRRLLLALGEVPETAPARPPTAGATTGTDAAIRAVRAALGAVRSSREEISADDVDDLLAILDQILARLGGHTAEGPA